MKTQIVEWASSLCFMVAVRLGEAATPEDTKLVVGWIGAKQERERRSGAYGATRPSVDEVCCRGQRLSLERQGGCTMKKHCLNTVIKSAEHTLSLVILLRGIGTGEPELNAVFSKEQPRGSGVKLYPIVHLYCKNRKSKLCLDIHKK
jgi:hypothetical protein